MLSIFREISIRWTPQDLNDYGNIGSGNGSVLSSNKPLPKLMLTQVCVAIWHNELKLGTDVTIRCQ